MSDWKPCIRRRPVIFMEKDGSTGVHPTCCERGCAFFGREVNCQDCAECPLRIRGFGPLAIDNVPVDPKSRTFKQPRILEDGTMIYEKVGFEPPSLPPGYKRKSDDPHSEDAWVLVPLWPSCKHRESIWQPAPCGCMGLLTFCTKLNQSAPYERCKGCKDLEPK